MWGCSRGCRRAPRNLAAHALDLPRDLRPPPPARAATLSQELGGALVEYPDEAAGRGGVVRFAPPPPVRQLAAECAQVFFDAAQRAQAEAQRLATMEALRAAGVVLPGMHYEV